YLWAGIAVGGGGLAYWMYKRNKQQKKDTAAVASEFGYAYGYGSEYAYGLTYEPYGYGYGPYGLGSYGYGGFTPAGGGLTNVGVQTPVPITATTNAQWSAAALGQLTSQGFDGTAVLAALGLYLVGGNLSAAQADIVRAAIAIEGYPPTASASGFPPGIHTGG